MHLASETPSILRLAEGDAVSAATSPKTRGTPVVFAQNYPRMKALPSPTPPIR
jgi:hypothetical protein